MIYFRIMKKMWGIWFVSLLLGCGVLGLPTMEDNKLPTDQELLGQPEEISLLALPSDEESFNHLNVLYIPPKSTSTGSGTFHFVSSSFPEIDARGFHESVFDGIGDYFPSWPRSYKRDSSLSYNPSLMQQLGLQPHRNYRKRSDPLVEDDHWSELSVVRRKRNTSFRTTNATEYHYTPPSQSKRNLFQKRIHDPNSLSKTHSGTHYFNSNHNISMNHNKARTTKREVKTLDSEDPPESDQIISDGDWKLEKRKISRDYSGSRVEIITDEFGSSKPMKRSGGRHARGMEMGSSGFHGDVFNRGFGDFTTMRRRRAGRGSLGFHADTFSDGFGDFQTMKRSPSEKRLLEKLGTYLAGINESKYKLVETTPETMIEINSEKRKPEMDSAGFHGDKFNGGLSDFETLKKRRPEMDSMGFHGDTFGGGFGEFETLKKRRAEMDSAGFHGDVFGGGFGEFETLKKRRPEMDSMGFHGDTFGGGFGEFETLKKRRAEMDSAGFHGDVFGGGFGEFETLKKRRPEMDSAGFHGDLFSKGFGEFETLKKRRPEMDSMGFHGDTFSRGFGDFDTFKKRRPEMDSMGFHGDTFSRGFGDFDTFKKRRPEMDSMGFHGDTFSRGFGDFDTYKKRRPEMDSMGFHGDTFSRGFGEFDTYKKRRPEMDSMGFHGDTFSRGFGEFDTYKKRRPEMDSMGFHGDTFSRGFGEFDTYKKRSREKDTPSLHDDVVNKEVENFETLKNGNSEKDGQDSQREFNNGLEDYNALQKRKPEMDSMGFHGDTFNRGFGDFYTMKRIDTRENNKCQDSRCHRHSAGSH